MSRMGPSGWMVVALVMGLVQLPMCQVETLPKGLQPLVRQAQKAEVALVERVCTVADRVRSQKPAPQVAAASSTPLVPGSLAVGNGVVTRLLPDDQKGSRHQRFILRLASGQTLLVAHNIDIAPRIAGIRVGDAVSFCGQYESNSQGGVIHWTHHDPQGRHTAGWLQHNGRRYQ